MRVLHIASRFWPAVGGAEVYWGEISARLAEEGHSVTVLTSDAADVDLFWDPRRRRFSERESVNRGLRILRFPIRHIPFAPKSYAVLRYLILRGLSAARLVPVPALAALARFTPWAPDLWRWLETTAESYDLVASLGILYEPFVAAGLAFARRRGVPHAVCPLTHLGAGRQPGADPVSRYYTMRQQVALVLASDGLIAMTPAERDFYARRGFPTDKIAEAAPAVKPAEVLGGDSQRFRARHGLDRPVVAFLSAMTRDKGAVHLVEAVRRMWRTGRAVDLVLAGSALEPFRRFLERLPPDDRRRLKVLGPISESEKRDLLAAADIVAMPSRTDSFGIVYLEAWLYGKPVIGAQAWGVGDVVTHEADGLLVPFGDTGALAGAIGRLLDDPDLRAAMGARGRQKALETYQWGKTYRRVRDLYRHLVQERV